MSTFPVCCLEGERIPKLLTEIPGPPQTLTYRGELPEQKPSLLTVVGSRQYSTYGKQVVEYLIDGLRGYAVGIVSGLALGIDSLAHEAALKNKLYTLALPGSGLNDDVLYPRQHVRLAGRILSAGGGLVSEFQPDFTATKWSFIARNRLMAGIARATLVIEATEQSGTLTTARMCVDYNRELLVVPGNIFSETSKGPHLFMKLGAVPITHPSDIVNVLDLKPAADKEATPAASVSEVEARVLQALREPAPLDILAATLALSPSELGSVLMGLELKGYVGAEHGIYHKRI